MAEACKLDSVRQRWDWKATLGLLATGVFASRGGMKNSGILSGVRMLGKAADTPALPISDTGARPKKAGPCRLALPGEAHTFSKSHMDAV